MFQALQLFFGIIFFGLRFPEKVARVLRKQALIEVFFLAAVLFVTVVVSMKNAGYEFPVVIYLAAALTSVAAGCVYYSNLNTFANLVCVLRIMNALSKNNSFELLSPQAQILSIEARLMECAMEVAREERAGRRDSYARVHNRSLLNDLHSHALASGFLEVTDKSKYYPSGALDDVS